MQEKISFAVVGCGRIGKRHASIIQENAEADLIALVEIDKSMHAALEKLYNVPVYSDIKELYKKQSAPQILNVCTPNYLHFEQSIFALENRSHVIVEKPVALSSEHVKEIISKSQEVKREVFCVMQNRYSPPSQWLKQVVESASLGKIYMVNVQCFWNRDDAYYHFGDAESWKGKILKDGGTLYTQFSHFVDSMCWIFGGIKNIQAKFYNFNHGNTIEFEDSALVQFDFDSGAAGSLAYSTSVWDRNMESSISVIAEKGSLKIGGQYMNEVVYCHIENYQMPELEQTLPANNYGGYQGSASNHTFVIQNAINTLKGREVVATTALEGMKVVEIIEKIYQLKNQ